MNGQIICCPVSSQENKEKIPSDKGTADHLMPFGDRLKHQILEKGGSWTGGGGVA